MSCPARRRRGFTLIELLVVCVMTAILIALALPAVHKVREAAARSTCQNNLKQLALATLSFHDAEGAFPPARIVERPDAGDPPDLRWGGEHPTWLVRVLPYLEQQAAFDRWDVTAAYSAQPEAARRHVVPGYICPSRRGPGQAVAEGSPGLPITLPCGCTFPGLPSPGGAVTDYAGNHGDPSPGLGGANTDLYWGGLGNGVIVSSRGGSAGGRPAGWIDRVRLADVTDGASNTALVGEAHVPQGRLTLDPENGPAYDGSRFYHAARVAGAGVPLARGRHDDVNGLAPLAFGSWHPGVCPFAFADGRVVPVAVTASGTVLERMTNRRDGQVFLDP